MKCSWNRFFRRLATTFLVSGATAWSSAMCYAQIAADNAMDSVYADGWQAGDNGGTGFGPWNFVGTYNTLPPMQQAIDDGLQSGGTGSSPYNNIGRAWTLFNPLGRETPGSPTPPPAGEGTDISQAGRAIVGNLKPGQTISVVIDNPTERYFFRGYTVRLNTGGGNTVYAGTPSSRLAVGTFEYGTNGKWYATGTGGDPTLYDTDTAAGMRIDVQLTGADTFDLSMTPLENPGLAFSKSGILDGGGLIDWIEFEFYNTDSDTYPVLVDPRQETDFYISSLEILPKLIGDMDRDRDVDFDDIDDFVLGLNNPAQYESIFGVLPSLFGDTDDDEDLDFDDIPGFVEILGGGNAQAIPEPSTSVLAVLGAIGAAGLGFARASKDKGQ